MNRSVKFQDYYNRIDSATTRMGDLKKMAREIKRDHALALELWSTGEFLPRMLATLILDKNELSPALLDQLAADMQSHDYGQRNQLMDWLMANQLTKSKQTIALMESWENSPLALQRRAFWYHQARLRWMGKTDHANTEALLAAIEEQLMGEVPEVQWAMNFTAGQIGKWQEEYRDRCIAIGENTGLYADEVPPRGCTPNYLPKFIPMEVAKLSKS